MPARHRTSFSPTAVRLCQDALLWPERYGTDQDMLQAYVGIVSHRGLELFCPEHPQTVRFLHRRVLRRHGQAACIWSVVTAELAKLVELSLLEGRPQDALALLQCHCRDCGFLASCEDQDYSPAIAG